LWPLQKDYKAESAGTRELVRKRNTRALRLGLVVEGKKVCPPKKWASSTKTKYDLSPRFCSGLSVPFTVTAHGEPRSSGRRGHGPLQFAPFLAMELVGLHPPLV
jgi:hypothetical protein